MGRHVVGRTFGIFGEPRVNVLELNLDLQNTHPGTYPLNSATGRRSRRRLARSGIDDQVDRRGSETMPAGIMAEHLEYVDFATGVPDLSLDSTFGSAFSARPASISLA